ncbi:MAG: hypothetical protein QW607_05975 [Desulfurococcaceae archaeon]
MESTDPIILLIRELLSMITASNLIATEICSYLSVGKSYKQGFYYGADESSEDRW